MSHYVVMPIRPDGQAQINGSRTIADRVAKDCLKQYWTDAVQAAEQAKSLAKKHPQVQFAVFSPTAIFETGEPKVIQKRMTESGEIVLAKEE